MIIGTVTCMTTIGILRLYHRNDHEFPIPVWLQKFVSSFSPLLSRGSSSIVSQHSSPEHMTETGWTRPNIADDLHGQLECWGEETVGSDYHSRRRSESRVFQTTRMGVRRKKSMKQENSRDGGQTRRPDSWKGVARAVDRFCFRLTLFIVILTNLMMMIVLGAFSWKGNFLKSFKHWERNDIFIQKNIYNEMNFFKLKNKNKKQWRWWKVWNWRLRSFDIEIYTTNIFISIKGNKWKKESENLTTVQQERQLNIFGSPNQNNVDIN